jgi:hypothetical protein
MQLIVVRFSVHSGIRYLHECASAWFDGSINTMKRVCGNLLIKINTIQNSKFGANLLISNLLLSHFGCMVNLRKIMSLSIWLRLVYFRLNR